MSDLLPFITDEKLISIMSSVVTAGETALNDSEATLHNNVIDPFSAITDAMCQNISLEEWLKQEKARQCQKTLQNELGNFHQNILGALSNWENLGTGGVVDLRNVKDKILAEVKNKFNTTKGNHKVKIYDDFKSLLRNPENDGFICYYVEIIPRNRAVYNEPFTPSDNQTHTRRPVKKRIRIIDGKSFYALATGYPDALERLFDAIPVIIGKIKKYPEERLRHYGEFKELLRRAYEI